MEPTQDRSVVLLVVGFIGALALIGLGGSIWLIHDGTDAASVAVVSGLTGTALGALGGLLASTRTGAAAKGQAEAVGFQKAVDTLNAIAPQDPAPVAPAAPAAVVPPATR